MKDVGPNVNPSNSQAPGVGSSSHLQRFICWLIKRNLPFPAPAIEPNSKRMDSPPSPPRSGGEGRGEVALRVQGDANFPFLAPKFFLAITVVAIFVLSSLPAHAQVSREYQLKAVFLYNFAQFTEWPESAFANPKSPIIIGIIGPDPFGSSLESTVHGETIQGHPLVIEHYLRVADIKTCHILFITQPEIRHMDEIVKSVKGKPVLTVTDSDNAASAAAIIRFNLQNNRVHFRINVEAARLANVSLSSKLLRVADAEPGGGTGP